MIRVWPLLVLVALLVGEPTPAFAQPQLKVEEKTTVKLPQWYRSPNEHVATFTPDGQTLAIGMEDQVRLYKVTLLDAATGKEKAVQRAHVLEIGCMMFNSDGTTLATGSADGTIKLWDMKTWKQSAVFEAFFGPAVALGGQRQKIYGPSALCFSPDSKTLVSLGSIWGPNGRLRVSERTDGFVRLWDIATGKQRAQLIVGINDEITSLGFSPDGKTLVTPIKEAARPHFWDLERDDLRSFGKGVSNPGSGVFSRDSKLYATSSRILNATTLELTVPLDTKTEHRRRPTFSPDDKLLAVETEEKDIELFSVETGKRLETLQGARYPFVFSPDGTKLTAFVRTNKGGSVLKTWELTWEKEPAK